MYFCQRSVQLWQAAAAAFQRHIPAAIDIWPGQPGRMHLRTWVPSPPKSESRSAFLRRLLEARIHSGVQHLHAAQRRSQVQGNTLRAGPTTLYRRPYTNQPNVREWAFFCIRTLFLLLLRPFTRSSLRQLPSMLAQHCHTVAHCTLTERALDQWSAEAY